MTTTTTAPNKLQGTAASTEESFAFPLSYAQERLWFLDQLSPGSATYNVPSPLRIPGPLNVAVLERCLNELVQRHESLRTTFDSVDGRAVQLIAPERVQPLPRVDLRDLPASQREAEAQRLAGEEAQRPFDLKHGPLMRTRLLVLADDDHLLLLTLHHIIADGWSMGLLLHELGALYQAFTSGRASPLPELPI